MPPLTGKCISTQLVIKFSCKTALLLFWLCFQAVCLFNLFQLSIKCFILPHELILQSTNVKYLPLLRKLFHNFKCYWSFFGKLAFYIWSLKASLTCYSCAFAFDNRTNKSLETVFEFGDWALPRFCCFSVMDFSPLLLLFFC